MDLKTQDQISPEFLEPYIIKGYRQTNISVWECIKSIFIIHNEFGNIWTHLFPLLLWIFWLYHLSYELNLADTFWYPLLMLWLGLITFLLFSSVAHIFGCKSIICRHICFMIDYHGISTYFMGGSISYYFYERPIGTHLFDYKWTYLTMVMIINLSATLLCCLTRFYWKNHRFTIRSCSYIIPYIGLLFPYLSRLILSMLQGDKDIWENFSNHLLIVFLPYVMVFFYVFKFPERVLPGTFDYFFQSHQFFHVMTVIITAIQVVTLKLDAQTRRSYLSHNDNNIGDIYSILIPFLFVYVSGFLLIAVITHFQFTKTTLKVKYNELHLKKND